MIERMEQRLLETFQRVQEDVVALRREVRDFADSKATDLTAVESRVMAALEGQAQDGASRPLLADLIGLEFRMIRSELDMLRSSASLVELEGTHLHRLLTSIIRRRNDEGERIRSLEERLRVAEARIRKIDRAGKPAPDA